MEVKKYDRRNEKQGLWKYRSSPRIKAYKMTEILKIPTKDFLAFSKDLTGALICSQMLGSEIPIVEKEPQNT